jgi:drug/metabolite transporter (DMT)-like permease
VIGVDAWDFTFGVYFVMAIIFQVYGFVYWHQNPGSFSAYYFVLGAIGSSLQVVGVLCLNLAISTGKAAGPAIAIISCQMLVLVAASAFFANLVPNLMQCLGLVFGLVGAMILVIPD